MFINLNYYLSIFFHIIILCILFLILNSEKQTKKYYEVININLKTLKTTKTENISKTKKLLESKRQNVSKNQFDESSNNISEIKKLENNTGKNINENNKIKKFQKKIEKETIENKNLSEKKIENIQPEVTSQKHTLEKKKTKDTSAIVASNEDIKIFNKYNDELKALIQEKATQNYPRISLRKKEQGNVELNFSIDMNGNILNITEGKKTNASQRLINSSIESLKLISPYKKNAILKKNNTFSVIIVYKIE